MIDEQYLNTESILKELYYGCFDASYFQSAFMSTGWLNDHLMSDFQQFINTVSKLNLFLMGCGCFDANLIS